MIKWWIAIGREMDLETPGNDRTDAIGEAKRKRKKGVATLLERFKSDAAKTSSEVRMELGITNGQSIHPMISSIRLFIFRIWLFV